MQAYAPGAKYIEWLMFSFMQTCNKNDPLVYAYNPGQRSLP